MRSTRPSLLNSGDDALPVARMGGNEVNMALAAQFWRRRTFCGREWAELRSTWPWLLNSETTHSLGARMGGNEVNMALATHSGDSALPVGENEVNVALATQFWRRRTTCGREWAKMKSIWLSLLNSGGNAPTVGEGGNEISGMRILGH